jgi:hypothetical protein
MDPLLAVGMFLIGGAAGYIRGFSRATEIYEGERQELRERVRIVEAGLDELEQDEQPNVEARMLERMYKGSRWP